MKNVIFVTSNQDKFRKAQVNLAVFGIELTREHCEMEEIQTENGREIVQHKAKQAFEVFKQPVLVNDDTWSIPALRGFPGTNMKQCNEYLVAQDWLRLMHGKTDRRVFLFSHYAYHTGTNILCQSVEDERVFLETPQGDHPKARCLEVIAHKESGLSIAQEIAAGWKTETENSEHWEKLARILN